MKRNYFIIAILCLLEVQLISCTSDSKDSVYICTGRYAHVYHQSRACEGLDDCNGSIEEISITKAERMGRRPCKLCCPSQNRINSFYGKATSNGTTDIQRPSKVYICTGSNSKRYHEFDNCKGLRRCTGDIECIPIEDAQYIGRTPCGYCATGESKTYNNYYDDDDCEDDGLTEDERTYREIYDIDE